MSRPSTKTDLQRTVSKCNPAAAQPPDVRGISAERKRLRGKYLSPFRLGLALRRGATTDDGD